MKRLVESWITAERERYGNSQHKAINQLNHALEMNVTHSRVSEWRRGVHRPSVIVISHMLYRALPWALENAGLNASPQQRQALDELLWVVKIEDGKRECYLL